MINRYKTSCNKIIIDFEANYKSIGAVNYFTNNTSSCIFCKQTIMSSAYFLYCDNCKYKISFTDYDINLGRFSDNPDRKNIDSISYNNYEAIYVQNEIKLFSTFFTFNQRLQELKYIFKSQYIDFQTLLNKINTLRMHDHLHLMKLKY